MNIDDNKKKDEDVKHNEDNDDNERKNDNICEQNIIQKNDKNTNNIIINNNNQLIKKEDFENINNIINNKMHLLNDVINSYNEDSKDNIKNKNKDLNITENIINIKADSDKKDDNNSSDSIEEKENETLFDNLSNKSDYNKLKGKKSMKKKIINENDNIIYNSCNINDSISYLRKKRKELEKKTVQLTRILSLKYEEGEELNNEIIKLEEMINKKKNNDNNKNDLNKIWENGKNNINKIVQMKIMINNYKNIYSNIKTELNNKIIEHKLNMNEIIISYEKKINKLIEKMNKLKNLKSDNYQIMDDITDNLFDDN
jgi:hypothetical protein